MWGSGSARCLVPWRFRPVRALCGHFKTRGLTRDVVRCCRQASTASGLPKTVTIVSTVLDYQGDAAAVQALRKLLKLRLPTLVYLQPQVALLPEAKDLLSGAAAWMRVFVSRPLAVVSDAVPSGVCGGGGTPPTRDCRAHSRAALGRRRATACCTAGGAAAASRGLFVALCVAEAIRKLRRAGVWADGEGVLAQHPITRHEIVGQLDALKLAWLLEASQRNPFQTDAFVWVDGTVHGRPLLVSV